jgi:hypothetical protein
MSVVGSSLQITTKVLSNQYYSIKEMLQEVAPDAGRPDYIYIYSLVGTARCPETAEDIWGISTLVHTYVHIKILINTYIMVIFLKKNKRKELRRKVAGRGGAALHVMSCVRGREACACMQCNAMQAYPTSTLHGHCCPSFACCFGPAIASCTLSPPAGGPHHHLKQPQPLRTYIYIHIHIYIYSILVRTSI